MAKDGLRGLGETMAVMVVVEGRGRGGAAVEEWSGQEEAGVSSAEEETGRDGQK